MLSQAHQLQLQDTKERRAKTDPQRQSISLPSCEHLQMSSHPAAAEAAVFVPVLLMSNSLGFNPYTCSKSQVAPGQARMQDRRGNGDPRVRGSPGAARRGEDSHSRGCSKKCHKAPLAPQRACWSHSGRAGHWGKSWDRGIACLKPSWSQVLGQRGDSWARTREQAGRGR